MNSYHVTHVDAQKTRRRLRVVAANSLNALAEVAQAFGDAWFVSAVRVKVLA